MGWSLVAVVYALASWVTLLSLIYQDVEFGPVGSNHGSLARARARGAGSPRTAQSLLLALGRDRTQKIRARLPWLLPTGP